MCYMLPCLSVERRINNRLERLLSWSLGSRLLAHFLQRTVLLLLRLTVAVRCAKFRSIKCQSPRSLLEFIFINHLLSSLPDKPVFVYLPIFSKEQFFFFFFVLLLLCDVPNLGRSNARAQGVCWNLYL